MYRVDNLIVSLDYSMEDIRKGLSNSLSVSPSLFSNITVIRQGLDSRGKPKHVLSVVFSLPKDVSIDLDNYQPPDLPQIPKISNANQRIIVVGAGPAGLMCSWILSRAGFNPIVLDSGLNVEGRQKAYREFLSSRTFSPFASLLRGEGGAGTFSDGKLITRRNDPLINYFFSVLKENGAPTDVFINNHPHLGTDLLQKVIPNIRKKLINAGTKFYFGTEVTKISYKNSKILINTAEEEFIGDVLFLATGGLTWKLLDNLEDLGAKTESRALQFGVRIEHSSEDIAKARYGKWWNKLNLPAAEYNFNAGGVHTFCMCPGGEVVCSSGDDGHLIINGMSNSKRNGSFSNSALITTQEFTNWRDAIAFKHKFERDSFISGGNNYSVPAQKVIDFQKGKISEDLSGSYRMGLTSVSLNDLLPHTIKNALLSGLGIVNKKLSNIEGGVLYAPETGVTPPYRIVRKQSGEILPNIYAIGEGSGYSSGISTSAIDGIKMALNFIEPN